MARCIRRMSFVVLCLSAAVLLSAAGCNHPALSRQTAAKPAAEKPDFSKLRPGAECRVELSLVDKRGGPSHVAYTGTVSRVGNDEVTLVNATRESGNEYGTPVEGRTPLADKSFKNRGVADREKVGTISIPAAEIRSIEVNGARETLPAGAHESAVRRTSDLSKVRPGAECQVRVAASNDGVRRPSEYYGTVARVGEREVVLEDAYASGRVEYKPPAMSRVPLLNRLVKNTAVGREAVGTIAIPTSEIISIEDVEVVPWASGESRGPSSHRFSAL